MPEYLAPGVYVEETTFRQKSIDGAPTSTAAFIGPTLTGPDRPGREPLGSFREFARIYGGLEPLERSEQPNHVAHAARAFFENGGKRLYVARAQSRKPSEFESALDALGEIDGISIIAAPGSTAGYRGSDSTGRRNVAAIQQLVIDHCEKHRHRFAVLDAPDRSPVGDVLAYRGQFDSKQAALYYPWVTIEDPVSGETIDLPPSGFVTGIYARTDADRGVHKAPANEIVNLAVDLEIAVTDAQQDLLNPAGVDCLRRFAGRGILVWGARTMTSDPEWKYVNVRRYFLYLEESIERGTRWVVFEPNDEPLWANVRRDVEGLLNAEWRSGALLGAKPEDAYFVRCDRSTMTQDDIDNGRLICLIGVALTRPAEFVIFRIGQKTVEAGS